MAYGTDTGGSVRVPAARCGVAGLKTAWGRVPLKGVYPLAPPLDTVGPLGSDIAALELGMQLMEPGFAIPPFGDELTAGRLTVSAEVDPAVDAAVDQVLAAGMIIDAEGFRANAYLMPYLDQLSPHVRRNLERGARLGRADLAAARRTKDAVREAFASWSLRCR